MVLVSNITKVQGWPKAFLYADDVAELLRFSWRKLGINEGGLLKKNSGAPYIHLTPRVRLKAISEGARETTLSSFWDWRRTHRDD